MLFEHKNAQNCQYAGASPRTPLAEPTALPRAQIPQSDTRGLVLREGQREGRKTEERERINVSEMHVSFRTCVTTVSTHIY